MSEELNDQIQQIYNKMENVKQILRKNNNFTKYKEENCHFVVEA